MRPDVFLQEKMLAFVGGQTSQFRHIHPVLPAQATGKLADVYTQLNAAFGVMPPFSLHSPSPDTLAALWMLIAEILTTGTVPRPHKESVATAVSHANQCPYCVDAHAMMLHGAADHATAQAIRQGHYEQIPDPIVRERVAWAAATRTPDSPRLATPPFSPSEAPELLGTVLAFTYLNRMVNIFLNPSPMPMPAPSRAMSALLRMGGAVLGKAVMQRSIAPGDALRFLPDAPLPDDMAWAAPNPTVAGALARSTATFEAGGDDVLPETVCALVDDHVQQWRGEDPGLSRSWVEQAVQTVPEAERPAARLALLAALAPYQIDAPIVAAFRAVQPGDEQLIKATAWASWRAARRTGSWLVGSS